MAGEAGTRIENDFQPETTPPRPPGTRPETEESQPICRKRYRSASEGRRGIPEEDEVSIPQDGPHLGFSSKSLLAPESADRQTPLATEADPCQEDFNPAPWRMPPEAAEKGA